MTVATADALMNGGSPEFERMIRGEFGLDALGPDTLGPDAPALAVRFVPDHSRHYRAGKEI
jgi:hypothetical protein